MTLPSAESERLIEHASRSRLPTACVSFCLSEPARSTRWNREVRTRLTPADVATASITREKTRCEREEAAFLRREAAAWRETVREEG